MSSPIIVVIMHGISNDRGRDVHAEEVFARSSMAFMKSVASGHQSAGDQGNSKELTLRSLEPQYMFTIRSKLRRVSVREDVKLKFSKVHNLRAMKIPPHPCTRSYVVSNESGPYGHPMHSQPDAGHGYRFLHTISANRPRRRLAYECLQSFDL